ncbi:MAG: hypothetical protein GY859_19235, partial [Desulfobacterales bacterium]|nr:hypothetical protein [Desulfobacterales bacterium]
MFYKIRTSRLMIVLAFTSFFIIGAAGSAFGYSSIYSNYKDTNNPENFNGSTQVITELISPVPSTFKVFVPPGATKATMIVYAPQGQVLGVAARVDNAPQCSYNTSLSETVAETLPWDRPKSGTLTQMRSNDYQMNNIDGQIEVFDWGLGTLTGTGHWVYIRVLNYAGAYLPEVNFTVNVNVAAYTDWYETDPFNGYQPPNTPAGPTGGTCE